MQCARARPNFWGALRSAANNLLRTVAMLCRLGELEKRSIDWLVLVFGSLFESGFQSQLGS